MFNLFRPPSNHHPIRKRLFLVPLIGVLVFTAMAALVLENVLRHWYQNRTEATLKQVVDVTIKAMQRINANTDDMQLIVDNISHISPHLHLTIANQTGDVVADTHKNQNHVAPIINIAKTDEFSQAVTQNSGRATHHNAVLGQSMLYFTQAINTDKFQGVVRVGEPSETFRSAVRKLRALLAVLTFSALIFITILVTMFTRYLNSSLSREHLLLEQRVNERTRDIMLLQRLTNMLAACQSIAEVQLVAQDIIPRIIGTLNGSISLVNASRNMVEKKIDWGGQWPGSATFSPEDCWALRKGKYHFSHDALSAQSCHHMGDCTENTLCIPLLAHGNAVGLFHLIVADKLDENDHNLAFTIAEHIGLALANIDMQNILRQQATLDPLTGLHNRRYFEDNLKKELNRAHRHDTHCGVLMLDIDHFKRFNDNFGHDAGDYVLKSIALILRDCLRSEDACCRLGGEELAIILPDTNLNAAIVCADKLRTIIAEKHFQCHNTALGTVTISIGIALYPTHADAPETLTKAADVALYTAKNSGRNRYVISDINNEANGEYCLIDKASA